MAATLTQIFRVLKKILAKEDRVVFLSQRGSPVTIDISRLVTSLGNILSELQSQALILADIDGNTDGIEALITSGNALLTTIRDNAAGIDALLTSIDGNTDGIEGKQDTGNTSLNNIDDATTSLEGKFDLLGTMGLLIVSIQATIILINAKLTDGGFDISELLVSIKALLGTIDTDTGNIQANTANVSSNTNSIKNNQDRDYGLRVWEYSETFTCTVVGTFIGVWQVPATSTLSHLRFGTGAFPMLAATNYQWIVLNRATATIILPLGFLAMQAFISNQLNIGDLPMVVGPLNDLQYGPRLGARALAVAESFTIMVRGSMSGAAAPPAVPVIGGTGTFTRVLNVNRVTNLDP